MTWVRRTGVAESFLWPTPTCKGFDGGSSHRKKLRAMLWPTPTASDARRRAPETKDGKLNRGARTGWCLLDVTGFSPHPEFIEWLMGYPIGWTEHPLSVTQLSLELPNASESQ